MMSKYDLFDFQSQTFTIDRDLWENFKKIKPTYEEGSYHPKVITWELKELDMNILNVHLSLVFRNLTEKDFNSKINKYQLNLFKRIYFDPYQDSSTERWISIGYKRPFGNSYVAGDIVEQMNKDVVFKQTKEAKEMMGPLDEDDHCLNHEINSEKLDTGKYMDLLYELMVEIIEKHKFMYTNFYVINTLSNSYSSGKLKLEEHFSKIQIANKLIAQNAIFIPDITEFRKEAIDEVLK